MEKPCDGDKLTVPLLEPKPATKKHQEDDAEQEEEEEEVASLGRRVLVESKKLWVVAGPSICARFSSFGVTVISQAFIGHIGATELAAYALVSTVLMRFSNGILLGMASALETLCGQSYGAKQYHMLGIYLQRSWIVLFCCAVILLPIYLFTTPLLIFLGQDPEISAVAGTISLWYIPVMFSYVFGFTLQMYLQAQSKNMIVTYLALLNLGLHLFLSWLMVVKFHFGLAGAMGSMVIAFWISIFGQLAFVFFGGCPLTWTGFSSFAFTDLSAIIKLSLSSGVMLCVELWYNTILVLLTGYMKNAEVALDALSICLNINGWEMMISIGFLAATGVRVANELGAGSARRAKFAIFNVVITSFLIGFILFVLFLFFRGSLAYIFTKSKAIADAVDDLAPLLAFSILLNSVQPVLSGVAIGSGWQNVVAYVNVASYYLIGIPIGAILGYALGFQVKGIWIGMLVGTLVQTLVLLFITLRTDWEKQVKIARERLNRCVCLIVTLAMERTPEDDERLTAPLLEPKPAINGAGGSNDEEEVGCGGSLGRRLVEENKKLWVVAGPSICARATSFGVTVVSQAFIGHIGATELAAYALVSTVLMRLSVGILIGMASALETLCGQSYGAKQYHMLGIYLQRSWIVLFCCAVILLPIYLFTTPLLIALGQDPEISAVAGTISLWYIPVMFSYVWGLTIQMYLQSQSKNMIVTYLSLLNFGLHLFLSWLMVVKFHLGLDGVMGSMVIAIWIPIFGQLAYVFFGGCPQTWTELWYNTILVLLTGYMKNAEVALDALSICLNINGWEMMIAIGFLAATGVRVANELGAGSARRANLAYIFTESQAVIDAVADLAPLLAFSILLNSVQPVLSGVAIGSGWQSVVAYVNVASYYLIGIPIGAILGYALGFEVKGIWIGMLVGTLVQTLVLLFITLRTDWEKQVEIARERLNRWYTDDNGRSQNSRENP
uniref:Protein DETOXIFICATION n=1 Tax=Oryza punctata TaxID=4537 RepID=A0A0E0MJ46_ORYPU